MSDDKKATPTTDLLEEKTDPAAPVATKAEDAAKKLAEREAEKRALSEKRLGTKFTRGTILIAEDDLDLQNALAQEAEDRGFRVSRSSDGVDAVLKTMTQKFDVILIDMNLPKKLGHEAVGEIRAKSLCKTSVIVVLSGYLKKEVVESLVGKIQKAFTKPADIENVFDTIVSLSETKKAG